MNTDGMNYDVSISGGIDISSSARVDFNSREQDGSIRIPLRALQGLAPGTGHRLLLQDLEGHSCTAEVLSTSQDVLAVAPLWETWRPAPSEVFINLMEVLERSIEAARRVPNTSSSGTRKTATAA
jgi:hypothetical protein